MGKKIVYMKIDIPFDIGDVIYCLSYINTKYIPCNKCDGLGSTYGMDDLGCYDTKTCST